MNRIHLSLVRICQSIGDKYQLNVFESFITPEKPLELEILSEEDQFSVQDTKSESKIKKYITSIRNAIASDEIEKAILQSIDLREKMNEDITEFLKIKNEWAKFKTSLHLGIMSHQDGDLIRNKIVISLLDLFQAEQTKEKKVLIDFDILKHSPENLIIECRDLISKNNFDKCFINLLSILGTRNNELICWLILLRVLSSKIKRDDNLNILLRKGLIDLLNAWKASLEHKNTSNIFSSEILRLLIMFIDDQIIEGENIFSYYILAHYFQLNSLEKDKQKIEILSRIEESNNKNKIMGTVPDDQVYQVVSQIRLGLFFMNRKIKYVNSSSFLTNSKHILEDLNNIIQETEKLSHFHTPNLLNIYKGLDILLKFTEKTGWDSLGNFLSFIEKSLSKLDLNKDERLTFFASIRFFCRWLSNLPMEISGKDNIDYLPKVSKYPNLSKADVLKRFYAHDFDEILSLLKEIFADDEAKINQLDEFSNKFKEIEFEEIVLEKHIEMNKFRSELLNWIETSFETEIDSLTGLNIRKALNNLQKILIEFLNGILSLDDLILYFEFFGRIFPEQYRPLQLIYAEINHLKKRENQGLVSSTDAVEQLYEKKKRLLDTYFQLREMTERLIQEDS